ncbi:MAG: cytochrome c peroxidase, partial [Planctomycetota bacterium]
MRTPFHALARLAPLALAAPALGQILGPVPEPAANPITAEKAVLGKMLFWDEQLSSDGSISCGTCHIPGAGGSDPRFGPDSINVGPDGVLGTEDDIGGSLGVRGTNAFGHYAQKPGVGLGRQVTGRHSQTNLMAAFSPELFWDGRAGGKFLDPADGSVLIATGGALENQSLGPLVSDVEMADASWDFDDLTARLERVRPLALASNLPGDVATALSVDATYPELFERAFGTPDIDPVRIAYALATYQRTTIPDDTPYDRFVVGDLTAMTQQQIDGYNAFNSTAICAVCHPEPTFTNEGYHALALRPSSEDPGRAGVTGDSLDLGKFRTPTLRNVALRPRWFHTGSPDIQTLRDAVAFYDGSGDFDNLDPVLTFLTLSPQTIDDVTAFMEALTDPRVAAETFPFDRPTLRSERGTQNPAPQGYGQVAGSGGVAPSAILNAAPATGNERYRLGLENALGNSFAAVRLELVDLGGFAAAGGPLALRGALPRPAPLRTEGSGP